LRAHQENTLNEKLKKVPIAQCDYPSQPRSRLDPDYCRALGQDMKENGQRVPVIGYSRGDRFILEDGGCRLEAARQVGIGELLAMDLGKEPTRAELLLAQASIDLHRQELPPIDRARLFQSLLLENQWNARQAAEALHVSETLICRSLALLSLPEELQRQVNAGVLDRSKGYVISQEPDAERQWQLAAMAGSLSRDALAAEVRRKRQGNGGPAVRLSRFKYPLASGVEITVAGKALSLADLIDALAELMKEAKRAGDQGLDIRTLVAVAKDKAKKGA
jgi:ParB family transcriptional regulator, chromosome partitioning protein